MMKLFCIVLGLLFASGPAFSQNAILENLDSKAKKTWRWTLAGTHLGGFGDERVEEATVFTTILSKTLSKTLSLDVFAQGVKVYDIAFASDEEFRLRDPFLSLRHNFKGKLFEGMPIMSYGFSLPFSERSQKNDIETMLFLDMSNTWMFFNNKLTTTLGSTGTYFVNRFTTEQTAPGSVGGALLPKFDVSMSLSAYFALGAALKFKPRFLKTLGFSTRLAYGRSQFEDPGLTPVRATSFRFKEDAMTYTAALLASPVKNWFVSVGFGNVNDAVADQGRVDYNLYDNLNSTWRVGLRHTHRF